MVSTDRKQNRPFNNQLRTIDLSLKRQLPLVLLLRVIILSILLTIHFLLQSEKQYLILPPVQYITWFIALIYGLTILSALLLKVISNYKRFAYIQIIGDAFLVTCLVFFSGGSQSIFTIIYFFPIIIGSMLLFRTGGLWLASICTIGYGIILAAQYTKYNPGLHFKLWEVTLINPGQTLHNFSIYGLTFFLIAILSILLAEQLRNTREQLSHTKTNYANLASLYKQIFEDIGTGIITVDNNEKITSFNPAAEKITGYTAQQIFSLRLNDIFPGLIPLKNKIMRSTTSLSRKDGTIIPVGYSWARLRGINNAANCRIYTMQDLSQIKKMEDQVRQAEKLAAIGQMAASIAHEFRNPIAAISGAAQLLEQDTKTQLTNQKLATIITRESERLTDTINDFLLFAKPTVPEKQWFLFDKLLRETIILLEQAKNIHKNCEIQTNIPANIECWADAGQIKQVLLNIISNSANMMQKQNGAINIEIKEHKGKSNHDKIIIIIKDNGPGISDAIINHIFEPFFTTREAGTGLGLAIVAQIIKSHDGEIVAQNRKQGGAVFTITLPLP